MTLLRHILRMRRLHRLALATSTVRNLDRALSGAVAPLAKATTGRRMREAGEALALRKQIITDSLKMVVR